MRTALLLRTDHWPLVTLELPPDMADLDLGTLSRSQDDVFARRQKYVSITDASAVASLPGAKVRGAIADWAKGIEPMAKRYQVANALVVPNPLARGVLTAVHWLAPPIVPTLVCATMGEGLAFLVEHAARAGLDTEPITRFASVVRPASRAAG
jgi:hypothetical protein